MNATLAVPRFANGRLDAPIIVVAALVAIAASVAVANTSGLVVRGGAAAFGVAAIALLLASVSRLELSLYAFIPLLTAVRAEPAPVDFLAVGLTGALAVRGEIRKFVPGRVVILALAVLIVSSAASLLLAPDRDLALRFTGATLLCVGIAYVAFQLAARDVRIAERAYVLAALLLGIEALVALLPVAAVQPLRFDQFRVYGLFKDPNVFGPFVAPGIALLCARWPSLHWAPRFGAIAIALAPVPLSLTRGAFLVVGVTLLVVGVVAIVRGWRTTMINCFGLLAAGVVTLVAFILFSGASLARDRLSTVIQDYDAVRFGGQIAGLTWARDHLLSVGVGPGNYEVVLGSSSHETYLRILVETGPLSLIAFLVFVWAVFRLIRSPNPSSAPWVAALMGFAAYGVFIDTIHWRHFWLVAAIALAIAARDQWRGIKPARTNPSRS